MVDEPLGEPIVIRFDGLDAERHELELRSLSEALDGLSRIIAATSHFAVTQELSLRRDQQTVRVVARPPRDGCFIIEAFVQFSHHHPMFKDYTIATVAGLTVVGISYIFARAAGKREEMRLLHEALQTSIRELGHRDQPTIERLLDTVDRMAESLRSATKKAVSPIGTSARTLSVSAASRTMSVGEAEKAAIVSTAGLSVDEERTYTVQISELDMQTGACHVELEGEPGRRHSARITDPVFTLPNNVYALSMAALLWIQVRAKATYRDGEIDRLFISNSESRERGDPNFALDGE